MITYAPKGSTTVHLDLEVPVRIEDSRVVPLKSAAEVYWAALETELNGLSQDITSRMAAAKAGRGAWPDIEINLRSVNLVLA